METIGYGFLLGVGILLAALAFALLCALVVVAGMFVSYMRGRSKNRNGNAPIQVHDRE